MAYELLRSLRKESNLEADNYNWLVTVRPRGNKEEDINEAWINGKKKVKKIEGKNGKRKTEREKKEMKLRYKEKQEQGREDRWEGKIDA